MPYKLSASLKAHTSDVRALSSPTDNLILSASRDTTAISWQKSAADAQFKHEVTLRAGSRYINAVAYIAPTPDAPNGYAVTGGQEAIINVFNLHSPKDDPDFTLLGHTENICALDVSPGGTIISGSWDRTAKVWKNYQLLYDLKGHQQSVWAVLSVDEDQVLTGSADKTIKLWREHKAIHTYTGHQDAVRGLARIPDIGFASCSNDSEIRVWTFGGDLVYTLSGHTSFVYSLSVLPSGDIVSAGEDRTVRVWKDGECEQTIVHPAISVWAVSSMPNGDIVSGCSDGIVRVFSASTERWASADVLKSYDTEVANQALPTQQVGDVKKSDLPGPEVLTTPGKKSGEVKMIKNGETVEAHQWDSTSHSWQKIGDVVDAVGSGRKQLYQGKEYDYVFDVDIQDGVPPLKLPYNVSENPYSAAQRFLQSNELSLNYIDEVVKFIEKNTAGVNIGTANEDYVDPFTGASRYRASAAPTANASNQYSDPFTGGSRYTPSTTSPLTPSAQYSDPFTGSTRYSGTAPTPPTPAASTKTLPVTKLVNFKQANVQAMQSKLLQFDEALRQEISTSSLAMYNEESSLLEDIFAYLAQVTTSPNSKPTSSLSTSHIETIVSILERWPSSQRFPVIDLSRLVVGYSAESFGFGKPVSSIRDKFTDALFKAAEWDGVQNWSAPLPKATETNALLLLRTLANVFADGGQTDSGWLKRILETLGQVSYTVLGKNQRVTLASVLFNISCESLRYQLDDELRNQTVILIGRILEAETADSEAVYRALVGLGNIAHAAKLGGQSLATPNVREVLQALPKRFPELRIRSISAEIATML